MDEYSLAEYMRLLQENGMEAACAYRASFVPDRLYKFFFLCDDGIENKKRFDTLEARKTWLAPATAQNDPYEFEGLYPDWDKLAPKGYTHELIDPILSRIKASILLAAFTTETETNLPMWAYYANNHRGFCAVYEVKEKQKFRNITYESERIGVASLLGNSLYYALPNPQIPVEKWKAEGDKYNLLLSEMLYIKHESWKHEHEYRLIYPIESANQAQGAAIEDEKLGIQIAGLYAGLKCSVKNKMQLSNIAVALGVPYQECHVSGKKYTLAE